MENKERVERTERSDRPMRGPRKSRKKVCAFCADKVENTKVVVAELGNDAGIIGAAFLGKMKNDN